MPQNSLISNSIRFLRNNLTFWLAYTSERIIFVEKRVDHVEFSADVVVVVAIQKYVLVWWPHNSAHIHAHLFAFINNKNNKNNLRQRLRWWKKKRKMKWKIRKYLQDVFIFLWKYKFCTLACNSDCESARDRIEIYNP